VAVGCDTTTNRCTATPVPGCCTSDADCGDANTCTTDSCTVATGVCTNTAISGCCVGDADCNDGDDCTADACEAGRCVAPSIPGCCLTDAECREGNGDLCTSPSCNVTTQLCVETVIDCDDADACTVDACEADGSCSHAARDCDDGNACTTDTCESDGTCASVAIPGCAEGDAGTMTGDDAGMVVEDDAGMTVEVDAAMPPGVDGGPRADAATPRTDGGGVDAGMASPDAAVDPMTMSSGCSCSVPGRSERSSAPLAFGILAMIAGVLARRRR
jgi:MYXO-CTERM domain-containing protein